MKKTEYYAQKPTDRIEIELLPKICNCGAKECQEQNTKIVSDIHTFIVQAIAHALAEREREIRKQFTILGGSIRTGCCDERIREDKDGQLWCMGCGKHMGGLVPKENL